MSTGPQNLSLGRYGERVAERMLVAKGMTLIDRNWRCPAGEIDLVLRDGDVLVVCEVKTRRGTAFGHPLEAVDPAKAQRLRELALHWLAAHDVKPAGIRIDVVGVLQRGRGPAVLDHVAGIA